MNTIQFVSMTDLGPIIESAIDGGSEITVVVTGNSMYPMLCHRRSKVKLAKAAFYRKYDVVLYKRDNGQYVLHRIVGMGKNGFFLAGDNEVQKEFPIYQEQIIATVKSFNRFNREYQSNKALYRLYAIFWCIVLPYRHKLIRYLKYMRNTLKK